MTTNFVHIVLYGVSFALILQVHPVSSMECGTVNFVRPVIIGGSDTVKGEWPFIVAIHNRSNYICGGTIISDKHILTAAHCIQRKYSEDILLPYEVVVRLGAYNLTNTDEKGAVQRTVSAIFVHPDWDAFQDRFDADIAILVLSENITFTDNIQPVCMPANGTAENMEGTVVGYGVRKSTVYAEIPRSISVGAVNHSHCFRKDNVMAAYSSERTFCGGNGDGSPDQGDSGSGYFYRSGVSWAQYGIVSMLRMNATGHVFPHAYHVYTNLTTFKDWIVETVNQTGGEVGEAKIGVTMTCDYQYTEQPGSAILPMPPVYICRVYNIDIQGNNFETGSFKGLHVSGKTKQDVDEIRFVNGTMSYLPSGFGLFFENIKHLTVGELKRDSGSLRTRVVRRFDLRYLRILRKLIFLRNDIEILHEDALWDLPDLQFVTLVENKLKVLANETFSKNRNLLSVEFQSNQLKFLPANLFKNNRLLKLVNFRNNFLKAIDDKLFRTNRGLKIVDFSFNLLETLPKRLFRNNLLLEAVNFKMNSLLSIDGDLFATNAKLYSVDFRTNRIESLPSALFQNNLQLRLAYFANNSIEAIDESLFVNNEKLFVVTFAFNRLKHLQRDVFKRALALHGLVFLGNSLKIIDIDFMLFENIGVIELDLNDCVSALYVKENLSSITSDTSFGNLEEFQNLVTRNCSKDRW